MNEEENPNLDDVVRVAIAHEIERVRLDGVEQAVGALSRRDLDAFLNDRAAVHLLADLLSTPRRGSTSMQWSTTSSSNRWRSSAAMLFRQHLITWFPFTSAQSSTTKGHKPSRMRLTMSGRRQSWEVRSETRGYMNQLLHTTRSMHVFRGFAKLALHHDELHSPAKSKTYELSPLLIAAHLQNLLEEIVSELVGHQ